MKKILIISIFAAIAIAGCKKKYTTISQLVTVSYPTITFTGSQYISIYVGGTVPSASATAYDSTLHESCTVLDSGVVNVNTPGLYLRTAYAKNKYGYYSSVSVYVAVTNVSDSLNLSGTYDRLASATNVAFVTKLGRGMFLTSNVGGDDTVTQATSVIPAIFAVTSDSTFDFGTQNTSAGTLTVSQEVLSLVPADTTLNYAVSLSGFGTQVRTFVKQ